MNILNSSWYWWVTRLSNYLLLGALWLLCSAPLITLFPSTVALFAVFHTWSEQPDEAFYLPFFAHLRAHFVRDFFLGLLWLVGIGLLVVNFILIPEAFGTGFSVVRALAFGFWLLAVLIFASGSLFIFPLRSSYTMNVWESVRTAVVLGLTQLSTTALCLGVLSLVIVLFWLSPATLLLSAAAAGHLIYWLCRRRLRPLETT